MKQYRDHEDGLMQERRNSSALEMELRLPCTKPSIFTRKFKAIIKRWNVLSIYYKIGIYTQRFEICFCRHIVASNWASLTVIRINCYNNRINKSALLEGHRLDRSCVCMW